VTTNLEIEIKMCIEDIQTSIEEVKNRYDSSVYELAVSSIDHEPF